jgi:fermentation-respiration switch protein FrsA (DUF1100 family)
LPTQPADTPHRRATSAWEHSTSTAVITTRAAPLRAVVLSTPGSSVKEQIGANCASRLAARGIAALAFDPAYRGQSGGDPATSRTVPPL